MQNVVKKYRTYVEDRFGLLRHKRGTVPTSTGTKHTQYILMTEAQCNAFLSFSRNGKKIIEKKLDLIADFEAAKNQVREQFERLLNSGPETKAEFFPLA